MIHDRKVIALVPIKEHSERVKDKNFRSFCGEPLYHHILKTLENTYAVDEVIINTDSPLVMNEAPRLFSKVRVIERPKELRGDHISVNKLIAHDLTVIDANIYLQTHATNPLLKAETIGKSLKLFVENEGKYDSLFSVNRFQSRFYDKDCAPINHNTDTLIRTQDLDPIYEENSNLYIFTKESFNKKKRRIGKAPMIYEMSRVESIDIDDEFSFHLAEILALFTHEQFKETYIGREG